MEEIKNNNGHKKIRAIFKKIGNWLKNYYSMLLISVGVFMGVLLIINQGDNINNLPEVIQFTVILTPFIILYI